mmetsp:Transcript_13880/g.16863  ORF Transcript_13880/g.16863 Transcript_13880/m.16863 type:complete len:198 (-) Transcript_13880:862-1455(-)
MPSSSQKEIEIDFGMITQDNVEQLRLINTTCFPISYSDGFYSDVVKRKDEDLCKFAYHNGFVIGAICARIEPLPEQEQPQGSDKEDKKNQKERIYIMTLGVLAAYRGRGVGKKLVQSILDYYQDSRSQNSDADKSNQDSSASALMENVTEITLHVQTSNKDAMKFYIDHFGFARGEMVENYYKRIDPPHCYVLRKHL